MSTVNLNLSQELQAFVNGQTAAGQYDGPAEYIEALIERAKQGKERIESLLVEGLDSGEAIPLDAAQWCRIRSRIIA